MSDPIPLQTPGGFAPVVALGLDDGTGNLAVVTAAAPLPVQTTAPAAPPALGGETQGDLVAGPFEPVPFTPVFCTLSGEFTGSVKVMRSTDGGATLHPLTAAGAQWGAFSGPACEPVWQESEVGATLWLNCEVTSGTLTYRLAQ